MPKKLIRIINMLLVLVLIIIGLKTLTKAMSSRLVASATRSSTELSTDSTLFEEVRTAFNEGAIVKKWKDEIPTTAEGYRLAELTIFVTNKGKYDAEWIGAEITPLEGDIAVYEMKGTESTVPAGGSGQILLRVVTTESPDAERDVLVSYYVYGKKYIFTVKG